MATIYNYKQSIDFDKHIFWQYNNATNLKSLVDSKQKWYKENQVDFWENWISNVINIRNANDYGLAMWGALLQIPRSYMVNGSSMTLTTNQYSKLLLARLKIIKMRGTIPEINSLLNFLFGEYGKAYVIDNFNMTLTYRFNFNLTDLQKTIIQTIPILPKPAGVGITIVSLDNEVFGFDGSGRPFDQGRFANYLDF